jgi:hypothetical protein
MSTDSTDSADVCKSLADMAWEAIMQLPRAVKRKIVLWSDFWEPEPALSFHLSESDGKELLKSHVARVSPFLR